MNSLSCRTIWVNGWWANSGEKPYGISKDSTSYERQFANWKEATALCYESGIKVYTLRENNKHGLSAVFPSKLYRHRFYQSEINQSCQP